MSVIVKARAWNKDDYAEVLFKLGYHVGAEIGVYNGEFSRPLLNNEWIEKLYLIDPYVEFDGDIAIQDSQRVHDLRYEMVCERFKDTQAKVIRKSSKDALADFEDGSLDFVYIDAQHDFENVLFDIENWSKKVRVGGMVSGHDYDCLHFGVMNAVGKYCLEHNVEFLNICEVGHIWMFIKGTENE